MQFNYFYAIHKYRFNLFRKGGFMKKILIIFSFALVTGFSSYGDIIYPDGSTPEIEPYTVKKFSRGLTNTFLAIFEIPKCFFETTKQEGVFDTRQITQGLMSRGPYRAFQRFRSGLYDLGTAFSHNKPGLVFASDGDGPAPHLEPEYIGVEDIIPGWNDQFYWDTLNTPATSQY